MIGEKIIVDVDTGIDDALALLMLLKLIPERILGITTCGGNVGVDKTTKNTLSIVDLAKTDCAVYRGSAENSLGEDFIFTDYHGENGIGDVGLPVGSDIASLSAVDFLVQAVNENAGNVTIVCLAPPTNLAKALLQDPAIVDKIKSVILMGGALNVAGNETPFAEFNFYQDPWAVETIFRHLKDIFIVPLDVTGKCLITEDELISGVEAPCYGFLRKAVQNWYGYFGNLKNRCFELYDPLAASMLLGEYMQFEKVGVAIVREGERRGQLISGANYINCAKEVDAASFKKYFLDTLLK